MGKKLQPAISYIHQGLITEVDELFFRLKIQLIDVNDMPTTLSAKEKATILALKFDNSPVTIEELDKLHNNLSNHLKSKVKPIKT